MTSPVSSRAHADLALAVYLEPHAEGRRVLLLGEPQGDLADRLDRIAAHLEIIDPGAREPSRGEVPELPFDDRAFDLILVCDVAALPEPTAGAVRELHRVLSRDGVLALASDGSGDRRRRGPPPQAALERLLKSEFRHAQVLAQSAIAGYAVGELDDASNEEFSIDSSLVKGQRRELERLLGVGSDARVELEPRLWVEVPVSADADGPRSASQDRTQASLVEELRRAEDEAREALHRNSDLLRKLELERNARLDAEHLLERAHSFEQKLLAAEADYDDAVARVRYFESAIAEHEATSQHDRQRREASERELARLKSDAGAAGERVKRAEHERDTARAELAEASGELATLEERLVELGKQVRGLEHDKKHQETTARDLLEELRRLEQDKSAAVEHDARVAELEAERDRAVQRALEAEVARESAQMRADELRAELEAPRVSELRQAAPVISEGELATLRDGAAASEAALTRSRVTLAELRGESRGLSLRLGEAERALEATASPGEQLGRTTRERDELRLRLGQTEAALHAMREASAAQPVAPRPGNRERALSEQLHEAEERLAELTRELEEADRFAELHAEDADRFAAVEGELEQARARLDELDDEVRALDADLRAARDELVNTRSELQRARAAADAGSAESAAQAQQLTRLERERDAANAALADARSILAQLAGRVGGDENDPDTIVQALLAQGDARGEHERTIDALRAQLADRDARIAQLERSDTRDEHAHGGDVHRDAPEY